MNKARLSYRVVNPEMRKYKYSLVPTAECDTAYSVIYREGEERKELVIYLLGKGKQSQASDAAAKHLGVGALRLVSSNQL
jgi:hypothetical protein